MLFRPLFDDQLAQYAYLVGCQDTGEALVVDPARDVDRYVEAAEREGLEIVAVAETHIHADFLSGTRELAEETGAQVYLSAKGGPDWAYRWGDGYDVRWIDDGDLFEIGHVDVQVLHTPGHTPEHVSFLLTDCADEACPSMGLLSGDFVFVGDTGRPDLLETAAGEQGARDDGARTLFASVQRFLEMDDYLQVWPGHGAGSACGKALGSVPQTTVGYERRASPALRAARAGEASFTDYILADQPEPPLYFARMKRLNRDGPPLLGGLPKPQALSADDLAARSEKDDVTVLDARADRTAFMRGHVPGALYAPFGKTFPTLAGSYVDPEQRLVLIIDEKNVDAAVRSLVRVGLDRVDGYATPRALAARADGLASIPVIDVSEMETRRQDGAAVLDVRSLSEYRSGHVPGAVLAPHTRLPERTDALPTGRPLLVHCGSGQRASSAASLLQRRGFDVAHVNDHFSNWAGAHPEAVETGAPVAA